MAKDRSVSRCRVVNAPAHSIFEVLADPSRHPLIDGSGSVRDVRSGSAERLTKGAKFGMDMRVGVPYRIENTVVEFEEDRLLAWQHFGGHRWRYLLEPADGGTKVTETFDWSTSRAPWFIELMRYPAKNAKSMEKTLERLAAHVEKLTTPTS